jgi:GTPase SAR1 family protein
MSDQPRKKLKEIINLHGVTLCDDIPHFEELLREKCGNKYKREIFMLVNACNENVVGDLLEPPLGITDEILTEHLIQRLYDNLGFDKTLAEWTVQSWAMALNFTSGTFEVRLEKENENEKEDEIELTEEFSRAFDLMEKTHQCVFITGKAGTGKSTLLQYFKKNTQKEIVVLAPTGVAALNVGGATLHSFFRLPPRPIHPDEVKTLRSKARRKIYQKIETIIIDEVSMVRADMMDVIDQFMRLNGKTRKKPYGGVQMIFIGDLFQLPPVVSRNEEALFSTTYQSPFFFSAKVFDELGMEILELTKVYRQKEQTFIHLLNGIRNNQARPCDLQKINQRYQPQFESNIDDFYITLTTTNKIAAQINEAYLEKLSKRLYQFEGEMTGKFDKGTLPTDLTLSLKEGAQVMFVKNDSEGRWVNGTLGRIKTLKKEQIEVETVEKQIYTVKPVKWEIPAYQFDEKTQMVTTEVIGSFTQYPLRLAWGMTIHKSQGKQFDKVIIDLGWGTFAHGQLYVALSRCKTLEGMILKTQVRPKDVIVDHRVMDFFSKQSQFRPIEAMLV